RRPRRGYEDATLAVVRPPRRPGWPPLAGPRPPGRRAAVEDGREGIGDDENTEGSPSVPLGAGQGWACPPYDGTRSPSGAMTTEDDTPRWPIPTSPTAPASARAHPSRARSPRATSRTCRATRSRARTARRPPRPPTRSSRASRTPTTARRPPPPRPAG